jgi:enamine deaminase RidA (YjgF/YER057c/UK114 family)
MTDLKAAHEAALKNEILKIMGETVIDEIKNLNEVKSLEEKLSSIEKSSYEDYTELRDVLKEFKSTLQERESFIRDILLAKTYIIDTNIFIDDPDILSKIKMPNKAVICAKVTDELDKFKVRTKDESDIHDKASKALKNINFALKKNKSTIVKAIADTRFLPADFTDRSADNRILCVALMYKEKNPCLLTSDNGLQVKAQICDIPTKSIDEFYNMLKAKEEEKAKGREVENGDVIKTQKVYAKNNKKRK